MRQLGGAAAAGSQRVEDNAFHLQFRSAADELAATQGEPPRIMRRPRDTDSRIGHNIDSYICLPRKTMSSVGAQIHLVVATSDSQRLREFPRS